MKTVWLVDQGCYSDYHVVGICSTEESAKQLAAYHDKIVDAQGWGDKCNVEEVKLNPGVDEINAGLTEYHITMLYDGSVTYIEEADRWTDRWTDRGLQVVDRGGMKGGDGVSGVVWAKGDQHATKIANEYRAQAIAEGRMKGAVIV